MLQEANSSRPRRERIRSSANFKDGKFQNLTPTEMLLKSASYLKMTKDFFNKPKNTSPSKSVPSIITDLKNIQSNNPVLIWFGHSSYFIKTGDISILVDPVFSGYASPISSMVKSFSGANEYGVEDFPEIDYLIITHDHYDHLDRKTIIKCKDRTKHFFAPLGVGRHLERWGIAAEKITEFDWWESKKMNPDLEIIAAPARHFSGRTLSRNNTLWVSYILKTKEHNLYIGGDSGYDIHFKMIGEKYGPFDLVMLDSAQYGDDWPQIHMKPEETVIAAIDLKAEVLLPVHWGKFALAFHAWNEPIQRLLKAAESAGVKVTTPMIGERVEIGKYYPRRIWWNEEEEVSRF